MEIQAKLHHATKAKADKLDTMLTAEYPALHLLPLVDDEGDRVTGWRVVWSPKGKDETANETIYEGDKVPSIGELVDTCLERDLDPTEGEDETPVRSGSVVPEEYRALYREVSASGQSCGDWLANFLDGQCLSPINGFNHEDFTHLLSHNSVDLTAKWAQLPISGGRGWQGRYRMNGRQVLERHVARAGFVHGITGERFEVPADELAKLRAKHGKWLAKAEKAEAKQAA